MLNFKKKKVKYENENENKNNAAFIDVETTGLARRDQIIEFAIALFQFEAETGKIGRIIDRYHGLQEPSVPINPAAARVHGLCVEDLKGKSLNLAKIRKIISKANILISHNAAFDKRFTVKLIPEVGQKDWLCSMNGISWQAKGFRSKSLGHLIKAHEIAVSQLHRAHEDVAASIELLGKQSSSNCNNTYLYELLVNCHR